MNIKEFARKMIEVTPQIFRGLAQYEHNYLTRGQITLPQFWALDYCYRQGRSKMSSIAHYLNVSRASATGLIDRLIIQQLVSRRSDSEDRRIVWIELTPKGKSIICSMREQKLKTFIKVFSRISLKDRTHYLNILKQVMGIVDSLQHPEKQGTGAGK